MNISEVLIDVMLLIVDAALGDACFNAFRGFLNVDEMDV